MRTEVKARQERKCGRFIGCSKPRVYASHFGLGALCGTNPAHHNALKYLLTRSPAACLCQGKTKAGGTRTSAGSRTNRDTDGWGVLKPTIPRRLTPVSREVNNPRSDSPTWYDAVKTCACLRIRGHGNVLFSRPSVILARTVQSNDLIAAAHRQHLHWRLTMAKKKEVPVPPSIAEMQQRLAQIEVDREKLEAALAERRQADLMEFAESVREQIAERGYRVDEVIALIQKGRRGPSRRRGQSRPHFVDPDNPAHTYSKGPLPAWLREKMHAAGYDAADKAQREAFKSNFLKQVA